MMRAVKKSLDAMSQAPFKGFSLAEILMTLAIMGLLAAFTVPKLVQPSTNNAAFNAKANDAAVMIMTAYQAMKAEGNVTTNTISWDLTPYMNYVSTDISTSVDDWHTGNTWGCDSNFKCLKLHNGGILVFDRLAFGGTATTNGIAFQFDPDGKVTDGTTNGPGKSVTFYLYYDGAIRTPATGRSGGEGYNPGWGPYALESNNPSVVPPWFSWQ
jgi:prepilin-type N-terminal cleavage/methylation domain-containing protein